MLMRVEERLINCIFYSSHEDVMDTFFKLLKSEVHQHALLSTEQMDQLIEILFAKIEEFTPVTLQIS